MNTALTVTDITALWGALTGTISLCVAGLSFFVAFLTYTRDKAHVKLSFTRNWTIRGPNVMGYNRNTTYACVSVLNRGRRPVTISKVAAIFLKEQGGFIFSDSMINGSRELTEGRAVDNLVKQSELDLSNISYFAAYDAVGNIYKLYRASIFRRFFYWLLDVTKIKKKKPVTQRSGNGS